MMKVYIATDHAGFSLKQSVSKFLQEHGYDVEDCGAHELVPNDDYPDFIVQAAQKVAGNPGSFGILFGGSGQGEAMAANKVKGIRCGVFYGSVVPHAATDVAGKTSSDPFAIVKLMREHNDANAIALSGRFVKEMDAIEAVKIFLETPFSNEERHVRRIEKLEIVIGQ